MAFEVSKPIMSHEVLNQILACHALLAFLIHGAFVVRHRGWLRRLITPWEGVSGLFLFLGLVLYYALLTIRLFEPSAFRFFSWPFSPFPCLLGISLLLVQLLFLVLAHLALGPSWSPSIFTHEGQRLITKGIYSRIRHPIYGGVIAWAIGAPLVGHDLSLLVLSLSALGVLLRVPKEERNLEAKFGQTFREYKARTRTFF